MSIVFVYGYISHKLFLRYKKGVNFTLILHFFRIFTPHDLYFHFTLIELQGQFSTEFRTFPKKTHVWL